MISSLFAEGRCDPAIRSRACARGYSDFSWLSQPKEQRSCGKMDFSGSRERWNGKRNGVSAGRNVYLDVGIQARRFVPPEWTIDGVVSKRPSDRQALRGYRASTRVRRHFIPEI